MSRLYTTKGLPPDSIGQATQLLVRAGFVLAAASLAACGSGFDEGLTSDIDVSSSEIRTEIRWGRTAISIDEIAADETDIHFAGYPTGIIGTCTGQMIGPNTVLTAAHCGTNPNPICFRPDNTGSGNRIITECFSCRYLFHGFPDNDVNVFSCDANAAGESPGDKYGYYDFDLDYDANGRVQLANSVRQFELGDTLHSIWMNPVVSDGLGFRQTLYSVGRVTSRNNAQLWSNPNPADRCTDTGQLALGVTTNLWTNPGASGSAQLSRDRNRIVLAPLSTGIVSTHPRPTASA